MDKMKKFYENDRFARYLGIELLEIYEGGAKACMKVEEQHLNSVNTVHGGALFSLADFVFSMASNSHGNIAVAINANISYFNAVQKGTLFAEGWEVAKNPRLATYNIEITDEEGGKIAAFQGMVYRKKETIDAVIDE